MRLVIAGGGTGGHLFPGIAVAEALLDVDPASQVLFVGTERGIEARAVPKAGFPVRFIDVGGLKGLALTKRLTTLAQLPRSLVQARRILREFQADAVLGVGGYSSGPVLVAARTLGLPTAICEQNSVPGLTNRLLARLVDRIFVTFDASRSRFPSGKAELVGNPVRRSFRDAAARPAPPVERGLVFTFGGSQGARPLNEAAPAALALLQQRGHTVRALHQAGKSDVPAVEQAYRQGGVVAEVTPFIDDMVTAYRRAHVVICRAGATSCAELTALSVAAILVPFPQAADDHQTLNARDLEQVGACVVLPQTELTPERLADEIERLIADDARRDQLQDGARRAGRLEAAEAVARAGLAGFPAGATARASLGARGVRA
ncbi:MAG: undecaprenyldiphospho-muramoylpentapeptide beta-N-acetylglucosaminyltransferase [Deltaproteobacteria bacterium RBG_16_71_12]|nr:MAG: undecaprenyldiphospho-muramoylpentapeptide beta-N-acetylglucosaminyltransferase [Deltaproteobacteria bacterium RBG_16_71_12]